MRIRILLPLSLLLVAAPLISCAAQETKSETLLASKDAAELASHVFQRERETIQYLSTLRPVVQIYVQSIKETGEPANGDVYFLGEWNVGAAQQSDLAHRVMPHVTLIAGQREASIGSHFGSRYNFHPDDLTQMF